jgi:hypothetical protein
MDIKLRPDEPDVQVCRSALDPAVWFCLDMDGTEGDMRSWENPGRLRLVKRWAEGQWGEGRPVRWQRIDADTYQMRIVRRRR